MRAVGCDTFLDTMTVDWSTCPPSHGADRNNWMLEHVQAGEAQYTFVEIEQTAPDGRPFVLRIFSDMLMLGGVRISVSAYLEQQIADLLQCRLMTARISDLVWLARAMTLPPYTDSTCPTSTAAMQSKSANIDTQIAKLGGAPPGGFISTVGKDWVIDNVLCSRTGKAANYGWHVVGS